MGVLARESLLEGGVTIRLAPGMPMPGELKLIELSQSGAEIGTGLSFEATPGGPAAKLKSAPVSFHVRHEPADGTDPQELPYAPPHFRVYFPGDYLLDAHGNLSCLGSKGAAATSLGDPPPLGDGKSPSEVGAEETKGINVPEYFSAEICLKN